MKYFLLTASDCYYPQGGTRDWIGCFDSYEEAKNKVQHLPIPLKRFVQGPRKGQIKPNQIQRHNFIINGTSYDTYEIIDLRDWIQS